MDDHPEAARDFRAVFENPDKVGIPQSDKERQDANTARRVDHGMLHVDA